VVKSIKSIIQLGVHDDLTEEAQVRNEKENATFPREERIRQTTQIKHALPHEMDPLLDSITSKSSLTHWASNWKGYE